MQASRQFRIVCVQLLSFTIVALALADDPAMIAPGQMQRAEATYREVYGTGHDKALKATKLSDKSEFAKKLWDSAQKISGDPALQEVLRKNALTFAQSDPVGTAVALEVHRSYLAFPSKKASALDKIASIQERSLLTEPIANRPKSAVEIIRIYREAATEHERLGNPAAALTALGKARVLGRKYSPMSKELFTALDADEKRLQLVSTEYAEIDRLRSTLEKNPGDLKTRAALGCRYLRLSRYPDAIAQFQATNDADWKAFAVAIDQKPINPQDISIKAINLLTSLPAEDKKSRFAILDFARSRMETIRNQARTEWFALLPTYTAVLDKISGSEPSNQTSKLALSAFLAHYDLAEHLAEKGTPTEALNEVSKAKSALKALKPADIKDFTPEIDQLEKGLKIRVTLSADVLKLQADVKTLDAKGQLALGIGLLRLGKLFESSKPLEASGIKPFQNIGKLAAMGGKASPMEFGNALRDASAELKGDEKSDILGLARQQYELYLFSASPSPDRTRVELLVNELPKLTLLSNTQKPILLLTPEFIKTMATKGDGPAKTKITLDGMIATLETEHANCPETGWKYKVVEKPMLKDEIRYIGYFWRTDTTNAIMPLFQLHKAKILTSGLLPVDPSQILITPEPPKVWSIVVRDLYKDLGTWELTGIGIGSMNKGSTQIAAIYVGSSLAQVRRAVLRVQPE